MMEDYLGDYWYLWLGAFLYPILKKDTIWFLLAAMLVEIISNLAYILQHYGK